MLFKIVKYENHQKKTFYVNVSLAKETIMLILQTVNICKINVLRGIEQ